MAALGAGGDGERLGRRRGSRRRRWTPRAAWAMDTWSSAWTSSPSRTKRVVGRHRQVDVEVAGGPAPGPGRAPARSGAGSSRGRPRRGRRRRRCGSRPGGRRRGSPGTGSRWPRRCRWQRRQGAAVTTWPRMDWRTRRSSPVPWQSGQRTAVVPARAPLPSQVAQATRRVERSLVARPRRPPRGSSSSRTISASAPRTGPPAPAPAARPRRRRRRRGRPGPPPNEVAGPGPGRRRPRGRSGRSGPGARGRAAPRRRGSPP